MWWQGRLVGFDLETTSPQPREALIVSAAVAECGGGEETATATWLADPGVPIPDEAAEVHGISTERAQSEGRPAAEVVDEVITHLAGRALGRPLVVFNARFDLTVLDCEARRHGLEPLQDRIPLQVVDPLVLDKWLDRFRRSRPPGAPDSVPSSRTLEGMCLHYGATLDGAHDAAFDALAAARVAWAIVHRGQVVRKVWNAEMGRERAALAREWERVRGDLAALHAFQVREALAERDRFAEYKASIGEHEEAARISAEVGWPILEHATARAAS